LLKRGFRLVFNHARWKLLSLAAAVAIWAMVASEPELSTFTSTQIEYKSLPDDVEMASNPVTSVLLELRGPSGELQGLNGEGLHPQVVIDLSSATPGEHTYTIGGESVKLPRGVRLVSALPGEVRFNFEPHAVRTVPVRVRIAGEGRNGYYVATETASPESLKIEGPAGHVNGTAEAPTDPVDVSDAVGTETFRVNAYVADPFVHIQSSAQVSVTVTMKKK
jgi:YbbR domain-containing protein